MPQMITDPNTKPGVTLNKEVSTSMACLSVAGLGFNRLTTIIVIATVKNVMVMRSRKG